MTSGVISNHPVTNSSSHRSISKRKKKKKVPNLGGGVHPQATTVEWKSDAQQQVYSSKLLHALRLVRLSTSSSSSSASHKRRRAVRQAADRVLAVTAKGRTRWSRSILTNRLNLKFMKKKQSNNKRRRLTVAGNSRWQKKSTVLPILRLNKAKNLPAVQRKARVLARLVPGCRKEPLMVILEEATDYIAALQMQVRAMTAVADLLSTASTSSSSTSTLSTADTLLNQFASSRPPPPL